MTEAWKTAAGRQTRRKGAGKQIQAFSCSPVDQPTFHCCRQLTVFQCQLQTTTAATLASWARILHPTNVRREIMKLKLGCSEPNVPRLRVEGVAREKRRRPAGGASMPEPPCWYVWPLLLHLPYSLARRRADFPASPNLLAPTDTECNTSIRRSTVTAESSCQIRPHGGVTDSSGFDCCPVEVAASIVVQSWPPPRLP